jgi:hypothetical protein
MNSKLLMIGAVLISVGGNAVAKDEAAFQDVLSVAEMAGACFILDAQIGFQQKNKPAGGGVFIQQFWDAEAARLGKTREQYLKDCTAAMKAYTKMRELAGSSAN